MKPKKKQVHISLEVSIRMRYLFQDKGVRGEELLKLFPNYSYGSIYRHAAKPINSIVDDKRKDNPGRPPKLSIRDKRAILCEIPKLRETVGSFTAAKRLKVVAGIGERFCTQV